jgi:hypothetical protein
MGERKKSILFAFDLTTEGAVTEVAFFSRSWNKASCLRKNRFSAAKAVRLRKAAA